MSVRETDRPPDAGEEKKTAKAEVARGNQWFVDDQFAVQLGNPASRYVIERRWHVFDSILDRWRTGYSRSDVLRILDAGCGDGINLYGLGRILSRHAIDFELVGCDYNHLRIGRSGKLDGQPAAMVCSLTELPLASASFDVVLCNHVLEHIRRDRLAMAELCRILRPGGLLIAGVPNEGCAMARLRNHFFQPEIARTTDHVNFYIRESFCERLRESGFEIDQVFRQGWFLPRLSWNARMHVHQTGRWMLEVLSRCLPSQAADLIVAARRPAQAGE